MSFELRAQGVPFAAIGRRFGWAHSTTRQILANEAYLGVVRHGGFRNESAHPAIVSRELFDAANAARTVQAVPPGETTRDRLLIGLARCRGCGRTLKTVRRHRADGSVVVAYYCKDAASEPCPDRAYVHADDLDAFVAAWFEEALRKVPKMVDVVAAGRDLQEAQVERDRLRADLNAYIAEIVIDDPALFQRGLDARQRRVRDAEDRVRHLSAHRSRLPVGGPLIKLWEDFSPIERRQVLAGFLDRVDVARGASRGLVGAVDIYWLDGTLAFPEIAEEEERVRVAAA
jgi:hypothetical protein